MEEKFEILELFPTPVYLDTVPPDFQNIVPWFDSQEVLGLNNESIKAEELDSLNYGSKSKNSYLLHEEEATDFRNYITSLALKFGKIMGYEYEEYKLTQSWLSWKAPGQSHTPHSHANSLISGVFYYGYFDENTPSIEFHRNVTNNGFTLSPSEPVPNPKYPFTYPRFSLKVSPGMIILFPSNLIHSVPKNTTRDIRKCLAFNLVPKEGFGYEKSLTELKF